jgi:hypothetical protein
MEHHNKELKVMRLGLLFKDIGSWIYDHKWYIAQINFYLLVVTGIVYGCMLFVKVRIGMWWILPISELVLAIAFTFSWEKRPAFVNAAQYFYVKYFMPTNKAPLYINHKRKEIRDLANKLLKKEL